MFGESRCQTRLSPKLFMPKHNKLARISHCLSESSRSIGTRGFSQTKYVQVFSHRGICEGKLTPEIQSKRQGLLIPASNLLTHQNSSALAARTVAPQTLILFLPDAWNGATPQREVDKTTSRSRRSLRKRITVGTECHLLLVLSFQANNFLSLFSLAALLPLRAFKCSHWLLCYEARVHSVWMFTALDSLAYRVTSWSSSFSRCPVRKYSLIWYLFYIWVLAGWPKISFTIL